MSSTFTGAMERARQTLLAARPMLSDKEFIAAVLYLLRANWTNGASSFPGWRDLATICRLTGSETSRERSAKRIRAALIAKGYIFESGCRRMRCGLGPRQNVKVYTVQGMAPKVAIGGGGTPCDGVTPPPRWGDRVHGRGVTELRHPRLVSEGVPKGSFPRSPPQPGETGLPNDKQEPPGVGADGRRLDYDQLHILAPIEAAACVTGERDPRAFSITHRFWRKAIRTIGPIAFRALLDEIHGETKAGEINNPGAVLAMRLKDAIAACEAEQREQNAEAVSRGAAPAA